MTALRDWLIENEQHYGGLHGGVPRLKVSEFDPRTPTMLARGGMTGGDRMRHHNYAPVYARVIEEHFMPAVTPDLLRDLETRFAGGIVRGIRPPTNSPLDQEPNPKSVFHGHRMQPKTMARGRNYAGVYAAHLPDTDRQLTIVELGILRGIGLAIWCDLFPKARVIGLDVDLSHFHENHEALVAKGAFRDNKPEVHEYDELAPGNPVLIRNILNGDSIDICIDDALHYDAAILGAMRDLMPFMRDGGVYFVEDNFKVHHKIAKAYPRNKVLAVAEMTVIQC